MIINLGFQNLDKNKKLIQNILENISASKIIRLSLKQEFYINKLKKNLHLFLKNNLIFSTLSLMPKVWIEIFSIIGICLFLFILEKSDYDKNYIITYLGFISLSLIRIIPSIMRISNSFQSLKYTSAAIEKIRDDVELIYNSKENLSLDNLIFKKKLVLQNVGFKFKNVNKWIFKNINLEIKNKENILIRGESGSGKTSLINIISGLYRPEEGNIFLDDKRLKNEEIRPLSNLSYVTQDTFLFDDSIKNNIAMGLEDNQLDIIKIREIINKVELDNLISSLEDGLDTNIGERGAKLSGGQAQRIGIARALYNDPDILILDEATNSLDKENEFKIFEILKKLKDQISIIMISHNPVENIIFDKKYELNNGKLIEKS